MAPGTPAERRAAAPCPQPSSPAARPPGPPRPAGSVRRRTRTSGDRLPLPATNSIPCQRT
ncbi:hypothetical protein ETD83_22870 [Actinomadura soli]|uniref:Uncharacterized protein n=1 Tax=Actinomadura soli TaxID=2508997 RepID=A0A5C4J873_9ACTN|nr:hypothetical protein ETD83_22870 [Actinomadura soli]